MRRLSVYRPIISISPMTLPDCHKAPLPSRTPWIPTATPTRTSGCPPYSIMENVPLSPCNDRAINTTARCRCSGLCKCEKTVQSLPEPSEPGNVSSILSPCSQESACADPADNLSSGKPELLTRIELVTSSLPRKCSTTELQQHSLKRDKSRNHFSIFQHIYVVKT